MEVTRPDPSITGIIICGAKAENDIPVVDGTVSPSVSGRTNPTQIHKISEGSSMPITHAKRKSFSSFFTLLTSPKLYQYFPLVSAAFRR